MTAEVLRTYRFRCDASQCSAAVLSDTSDVPSDWTTVTSTDYQAHAPLPSAKSGRARLRAMDVISLRSHGRFWLHLCPDHPDALAGHLPQTDNPGGQGVSVSCSCGEKLASWTDRPRDVWLRHFEETSRAEAAPGQTQPTEGDQVT